MENSGETVQEAWDRLGEAEKADEQARLDEEVKELTREAAKGLRKDPGDVILALYECIRDVAKTAGIQTRLVIETMYEIDCTLSHIGGV